MTQLSSFSRAILVRTEQALLVLEKIIRAVRQLLLDKCPLYASNVLTVLVLVKDLAGFVPPFIYKLILAIVIYSVAYRKLRKWRKRRAIEQKQPTKQQNLQNLSLDFQVRTKLIHSIESDSLQLQLSQQPRQFRDIVFFDLMRSYREFPQ